MNYSTKIDWIFLLIISCVFGVFVFVGYRDLDIQFLSFTAGDELPQFKQLNNLLNGFLGLDLEGMFRYEFYNYGYFYYLLNLLVSAPFNLASRTDLAIYAPRVLNGVFSVLNLWVIYKIAKLYLSPLKSLAIVVFCLTLPGFWAFGYIFKPDVFQAFFVLLCVYFLCLDAFRFGRNYYFAILMLGFGIGFAKFQAVMFLPLICIYVFYYFFKCPSVKTCLISTWESLKIVLICLLIWVITNPYVLHPSGARAWWNMFALNMQSNATNHGSHTQVSLSEKILGVLGEYFINPYLIATLVLSLVYVFYRQRKEKIIVVFYPIFVSFVVSLLYLLFMVNKAWEIYYISTMYLAVVLLIPIMMIFQEKIVIGALFAFQAVGLFAFSSMNHFYKHPSDLSSIIPRSNELLSVLRPLVQNVSDKKSLKIYTSDVNFAYSQLGLGYQNIHQIFSGVFPYYIDKAEFVKKFPYKNPSKYFYQWDLIVVDKQMLKRNQEFQDKDVDQKLSFETISTLGGGGYGYRLVAESGNFYVYQYFGD